VAPRRTVRICFRGSSLSTSAMRTAACPATLPRIWLTKERQTVLLARRVEHAFNEAVCARQRSAYDVRMARILMGLFGIFCALIAWPLSVQAHGLRVAIFDFELIDTSHEGATNGPQAEETAGSVINCARS
jgi:hypothetical protein